ncbi:MAG: competence/damage-inducible protein A [Firmicutes bacterium]|nr:competence/damage-inducible protein A [Bacillota bacterium]
MGEITNTNTVFLSQKLNDLGIDVLFHHTVGDNPGRLSLVLKESLAECDLIITTGGLGPTQDDMTKEVVCKIMRDELVMNEKWLAYLYKRYERRGRKMTDNNRKQALIPSRATMLFNEVGSAPGFVLKDPYGRKAVCCLPGPPREMKWMYENKLEPILSGGENGVLAHRMLRTFGIGESSLETALLDLIDGQTDPTIATYAKEGECAVRVASKRETAEEAETAVENMVHLIAYRIGEYIYSYDDVDLVRVVADQLIERNLTLAAAESCTGGMFGAAMTDVPGISAVFDRSLVTYSNEAKMQELGVREETLEQYGAVSEETAREMAEGVREASGADIGISVTGIAGPDGGTEEKPVGTVYYALATKDHTVSRKTIWNTGNRRSNRNYAVLNMLDMIRREFI